MDGRILSILVVLIVHWYRRRQDPMTRFIVLVAANHLPCLRPQSRAVNLFSTLLPRKCVIRKKPWDKCAIFFNSLKCIVQA